MRLFAITMDTRMLAQMLILWCTLTQSIACIAQARKCIQKRLQRSREQLNQTRRRLLQWRINVAAMVFLALALEPVNRNVWAVLR